MNRTKKRGAMNDVSKARNTRIITVANQKGGVGKSTNSINIAAAMGERGLRSLLIDLDATSGATKALKAPTSGWMSTFEFITREVEPTDCIIDEHEEGISLPRNVHLVPSSRKLNELDAWLLHPDNRWANPLDLLNEPLGKLKGLYDFIILDTPPQITKTSLPAYKVADYIILSATPERLAVDGLADALTDINNAQRAGNENLQLLGVIFCSFQRGRGQTRLSKQLIDYVETHLKRPDGSTFKFNTDIFRNVAIQEAQQVGQSIFEYAPEGPSAEQYRELVKEILVRIEQIPFSVITPQAPPASSAVSSDVSQEQPEAGSGEVAANA